MGILMELQPKQKNNDKTRVSRDMELAASESPVKSCQMSIKVAQKWFL